MNVQAILEDGSYHDVDSSEMAFNICGFNCMRDTLKKAGMVLLEPIMTLEVEAPAEYQGPVSGHLSSKRGIITSSEIQAGSRRCCGPKCRWRRCSTTPMSCVR